MNTSPLRSTFRASAAAALRAQLSPLRRRAPAAALRPARPEPLNLERWWQPRLLDRLQMPLSRIHE